MSMAHRSFVVAGGTALTVVALAHEASAQTTSSSSGGADWSVVFVIGVVFAVACGLVAKNKNRSVVLWAALGFLFGFIPLIVIAVLKKVPEMNYGMGGGSMTPPPPPPPPMP